METIRKYKWYLVTIIGIIILLFMHLYKLSAVPYGLNVDEASGAYDALNIARYGVDRYLKSYPVYFTNYGDGQNALYIYATAVWIKLFGVSKFVIRLTAAMAAIAAAYFGWKYMNAEKKNGKTKIIWLLLYAVLPVFVMTQRFGLESHLMLPMSMVCLYFTAKAIDEGKWADYLLAGLTLGITLYTYALTYIVIPVYLLLLLVYVIILKKAEWRKILLTAAVLAFLAAPLILVQVINLFDLPEIQLGPVTFTKLLRYRGEEVAGISVVQNIKSMFTNTFFYDDLTYNTSAKYGTMFFVSVPFVLLGLGRSIYEAILSVKKKSFSYAAPMVFWFVAQWTMGSLLSGDSVPNTTRMIGVFMSMLYFLVKGLCLLWEWLKSGKWRMGYAVIMSVCYGALFLHFSFYYFSDYNEEAYPMKWLFFESYDEVGDFLAENEAESWHNRAMAYPWNYIYYALEYEVNPYELNLPVNGKEQFGEDYINEYPPNTKLDANYVVYKTDLGSMDFLKKIGYREVFAGENYHIFVSPLDCYAQIEGQSVITVIDNYKIENDQIKLEGWCAEGTDKKPLQNIVLETDFTTYNAQYLERTDVAAHLGTEGDAYYGFSIQLPLDIFTQTDYLRLSGTDEQGMQKAILYYEKIQ